MPLNLLIMRHAKAKRPDGLEDQARPLNKRGRRDAERMGRFLAAIDRVPDLVLCSPAERTVETLERAAGAGKWSSEIRQAEALYGRGPTSFLSALAEMGGEAPRVLVVGHEPTCGQVVRILCGASVLMPTGAVADLEVNASEWSVVSPQCADLRWLVGPKLLAGAGGS